eukprot:g8211.t1
MDEADMSSAYTFRTTKLLPEIQIDTSRLDGLLSGFQRRLTALESSFAKIAESAAEAAHKVVMTSSPSNTAPPSPARPRPWLANGPAKEDDPPRAPENAVPELALPTEDVPAERPKADTAEMEAAIEASAESLKNTIQPQVDALWDAVKWMEDRMEIIDTDRRGELEDAARVAAQNTAKGEVAKMERERMKLALEDRPVRSEFEALNELHEDRLRATEGELRRLIAELSNRLQANAINGENKLSAGIASLRAEFAQLLLRMEEGELQKDQFVREIDDRVCEGGQEVEISLSRMKGELLEQLGLTQMDMEKLAMQQEKAVTPEILNEVLRGSEAIREVSTKAFSLEEDISVLSASLKAAEKKLVQVDETSSQVVREAERRMSARVQTVANAQTAVEKQVLKLKEKKADEDSLRETRDELAQRLTTLEDVTAAGRQELVDLLRSEVDTALYRVSEAENMASAVREDLSPEIARLEDSVESVNSFLKRALEDHQRILDVQDAKVAAFSGEVSDACSSVTSEVRDMLVCLTPSSKRGELERKDNPEDEATLAEVATAVREQQQQREESSKRVERANLGLTVLVKKLERSLFVLSSKGLFWEAMGNKLKAHAEAFADASCRVEAASEEQDRFVLTTELQHYVAGNTQRVAKLICQKADFEVAMSKYRSVDVGNTLFGKVKLDPSCIACDRPFGPAGQATLGDARAAPLDPLPPALAAKDAMAMAGRPRTPATPPDGMRAPDPFIDSAMAGSFGGGRHQKTASKFVYRGGFKIPKELTPMPSIESFPGGLGGTTATNSVVLSSNGGFEIDADASRDAGVAVGVGGFGNKLRDPGSASRRTVEGDPGESRGLGGIISSSRMRVGRSSERGGGRDGVKVKMPRPKTAGATVGRGGSVISAGSTEESAGAGIMALD